MPLKSITTPVGRYISNPSSGFCPATDGEQTVFGARRPGFPFRNVPRTVVSDWLAFMQHHSIQQIVCLLPAKQLAYYPDDLLDMYRTDYGDQNVCWAPIDDFRLADPYLLTNVILPFLIRAERRTMRVVVHCSGGIGRTGHVLAAWLVAKYGLSNAQAIEAVRRTGRNPTESRDAGLDDLLNSCRQLFVRH